MLVVLRQRCARRAAVQLQPHVPRLQPYMSRLQPHAPRLQPYVCRLQPYVSRLQPHVAKAATPCGQGCNCFCPGAHDECQYGCACAVRLPGERTCANRLLQMGQAKKLLLKQA